MGHCSDGLSTALGSPGVVRPEGNLGRNILMASPPNRKNVIRKYTETGLMYVRRIGRGATKTPLCTVK
jgi:hypothetical protein